MGTPFHSSDPVTQLILDVIFGFIRAIFNANYDGQDNMLIQFCNVISLRAFAGQYWKAPGQDWYAAQFAIAIDNLIDVALRIMGMDPQIVRGDH